MTISGKKMFVVGGLSSAAEVSSVIPATDSTNLAAATGLAPRTWTLPVAMAINNPDRE